MSPTHSKLLTHACSPLTRYGGRCAHGTHPHPHSCLLTSDQIRWSLRSRYSSSSSLMLAHLWPGTVVAVLTVLILILTHACSPLTRYGGRCTHGTHPHPHSCLLTSDQVRWSLCSRYSSLSSLMLVHLWPGTVVAVLTVLILILTHACSPLTRYGGRCAHGTHPHPHPHSCLLTSDQVRWLLSSRYGTHPHPHSSLFTSDQVRWSLCSRYSSSSSSSLMLAYLWPGTVVAVLTVLILILTHACSPLTRYGGRCAHGTHPHPHSCLLTSDQVRWSLCSRYSSSSSLMLAHLWPGTVVAVLAVLILILIFTHACSPLTRYGGRCTHGTHPHPYLHSCLLTSDQVRWSLCSRYSSSSSRMLAHLWPGTVVVVLTVLILILILTHACSPLTRYGGRWAHGTVLILILTHACSPLTRYGGRCAHGTHPHPHSCLLTSDQVRWSLCSRYSSSSSLMLAHLWPGTVVVVLTVLILIPILTHACSPLTRYGGCWAHGTVLILILIQACSPLTRYGGRCAHGTHSHPHPHSCLLTSDQVRWSLCSRYSSSSSSSLMLAYLWPGTVVAVLTVLILILTHACLPLTRYGGRCARGTHPHPHSCLFTLTRYGGRCAHGTHPHPSILRGKHSPSTSRRGTWNTSNSSSSSSSSGLRYWSSLSQRVLPLAVTPRLGPTRSG